MILKKLKQKIRSTITAEQELEIAEQELDIAEQELDIAEQELDIAEQELDIAKKILIVSMQKSGTHLINKILGEGGFEGVDFGKNCTTHDFVGLQDNQYLWTHFTPSDEFQMALEKGDESVYIIFNFRDPRDVLVSWFYWQHPQYGGTMHLHQEYMRKVYSHFTDDELINIFIRNDKFREVEYNPIEQYRFSRVLLFHPSVLKVRFEDLVGGRGGGCDSLQKSTIRRIFDYLDCENIDIERIATHAYDSGSATFRKGQIGSYKDALSREQICLFNKLHGDIILQYGYAPDD